VTMKKIWVRWAGGIETRDDGYTIYHNPGFAMLSYPEKGKIEKFPTAEAAKREVDKKGER